MEFIIRKMSGVKIVIIGAGAAGIACATKLLEYGFQDLIILEAESRIGGRIKTIPFADNVVDLGAQWCHGEKDNIVFEIVKKHKLLAHTLESEKYTTYIRSNGEVVDQKIQKILLQSWEDIMLESFNIKANYEENLREYLTAALNAHVKLEQFQDVDKTLASEFLENFLRERCTGTSAVDVCQTSARLQAKYKHCVGDELLTWQDKGYKSYLEILLKKQEIGEEFGVLQNHIRLAKKVKQVAWKKQKADKILIKTATDEEFLVDHVIVTVSLGVLKDNHKSFFVPALPEIKISAIENLGFGIVNKLLLEFEQPFWPENWTGVSFLWRQADLDELNATKRLWLTAFHGFGRVAHQPRVLISWIVGPHCLQIEKLTNEQVKCAALYLLRRFLSKSSFKIAEPVGFVRSTWKSETHFCGSWSYQSMETAAANVKNADLATPLYEEQANGKPLVLFAGEATHDYYFSTVHGATESGFREAKRLKDFYNATGN